MNGIPEPYRNGTHHTFEGNDVVIFDHAPNGDSWRYEIHRADLAGPVQHVGHDDLRPAQGPQPLAAILPGVVHELVRNAGLSNEEFDRQLAKAEADEERRELSKDPRDQIADAVSDWVHGRLPSADLRQTAIMLGFA